MKCSNCGKEIREGNSFCTNCGTKAVITSNNNNIENININADSNVAQNEVNAIKEKKKIPTSLKIIIPIVVILAVMLIIVFCNNKNDEETSTDEVIETVEETGTSSIETGIKYYYVGENKSGYLKFNSETAFIIKIDYDTVDYQFTGTYTIEDNIITLTVTFDSFIEDIEAFEPYTETMTILEDETIEWVTNAETYIFDKNLTIEETTTNTVSSEDLLEQIYALYPALEDTDGIICTDGDSYWLLDESGNKVYFYDLDSFESALTQCNIDVDNLGDTTEDTSTTTTNSTSTSNNTTSSSTSKSTNSTSSNSSSQNTNSPSSSKSSTSTEKTMYIEFHRSCLASKFLELDSNGNLTLTKNLSVKVTANGTTIFSDTITSEDVLPTGNYDCKTSLITYTGIEAPTIIVYVDGEIFRTYDPDTTIDWFDSSSTSPQYLGFIEHGAG